MAFRTDVQESQELERRRTARAEAAVDTIAGGPSKMMIARLL